MEFDFTGMTLDGNSIVTITKIGNDQVLTTAEFEELNLLNNNLIENK